MKLPIDWASVDWVAVGVLSGLAFVASFLAQLLSFGNKWIGAFLTAVLFGGLYIVWIYYARDLVAGSLNKPG